MHSQQANLIEALDRADEFLTQNAAVLEASVAANARTKFTALRERLVRHMKEQDGSRRAARGRVTEKQKARNTLVDDHMRPLVLLARAELVGSPTPPAFRLPRRHGRYAGVIAAGYGMAQAAEPYREAFAEAGMNADFIERLVEATDTLRAQVAARADVTARRVAATAGLRRDGAAARRYFHVVDALVRRGIKSDGALVDKWAHVSRVVAVAAAAAESAGTPAAGTPAGTTTPVSLTEGAGGTVGSISPRGEGSSGSDDGSAEKVAQEPARATVAA